MRCQIIGREVLGPLFCTFIERLVERSAELGIERLFFLAREGWLLQRLYALVCEQLAAPSLPHVYLYVSRLSTSLPSVRDGIGLRELRMGCRRPGDTLLTMLASFGLNDDAMLEQLAAADIDPKRPIHDPWHDLAVERLLEAAELRREVDTRARHARAQFRRYLAQEGLFDRRGTQRRCAFVDIGWSGTIQKNVARAFADDAELPDLWGLYLATADGRWMGWDPAMAARIEGLISDHRDGERRAAHAIFHFLEIFEQSARAPHGTTTGYRELGGRVEPIVKEAGSDRQAERKSDAIVVALQAGILACARDWRAVRRCLGDDDLTRRQTVVERLERFVLRPTRAEVTALAQLSHTDDWGLESHAHVLAGGTLRSPLRWAAQLQRSYWKAGFARATGGPVVGQLYAWYVKLKDHLR